MINNKQIPIGALISDGRVMELLPKGTLVLGADFDAELLVPCYILETAMGKRICIPLAQLHFRNPRACIEIPTPPPAPERGGSAKEK